MNAFKMRLLNSWYVRKWNQALIWLSFGRCKILKNIYLERLQKRAAAWSSGEGDFLFKRHGAEKSLSEGAHLFFVQKQEATGVSVGYYCCFYYVNCIFKKTVKFTSNLGYSLFICWTQQNLSMQHINCPISRNMHYILRNTGHAYRWQRIHIYSLGPEGIWIQILFTLTQEILSNFWSQTGKQIHTLQSEENPMLFLTYTLSKDYMQHH